MEFPCGNFNQNHTSLNTLLFLKRLRTSELEKSAAPTIGALDSLQERQADAVANAVMAGKRVPTITPLGHGLSRSCETCEVKDDLQRKAAGLYTQGRAPASAPAWEAAAAVANGGRPLSASELAFFEPRFQYDFSRVRVHDGSRVGKAAQSINARAYALGQNIAFAPGEYQPHSSEGRRLMAHELAHTVQSGSQSTIRRTCPSGYQYDIYEDEVNFEDSVDAIRALPEFGALKDKDCGDGKKFTNDIIDGARASACPGFYIEKLQPIFAKDTAEPEIIKQSQQEVIDTAAVEHGSKDWLEILNEGWEASKRKKITEDSQRQYRSVPANFGIVEDNFVDSFRIDSRNPQDVVVKLKIRLIPRGSGSQDDVTKTKRLEKAIEEHATIKGYTLDLEFVDREGPGVVTVGVDTGSRTVADNWVGDPKIIAHELHHVLRLEDRYSHLTHATNELMTRECRLFWFREQMVRAPDPLAKESFMKDSYSSTKKLQDLDVCALVVGIPNDPSKFRQCLSDRAALLTSAGLAERGTLLMAEYEPRLAPMVQLLREAWKRKQREECQGDPYCEEEPPVNAFGVEATIDADASRFNGVIPNPHVQPPGSSLTRKSR